MKNNLIKVAGATLGILFSLVSCAHTESQAQEETRQAIYSNVTTQHQAGASIRAWDDRINKLKIETTGVASRSRFKMLEDKIGKLDSKMKDVRSNYLDMRLADTKDKQKFLNNINEDLNKVNEVYSSIAAE